jgi:hypothetical protein
MKVYVLKKLSYDYMELLAGFKCKEDAESYLYQLIINNGRINISDKIILKRFKWNYEIEEIEII